MDLEFCLQGSDFMFLPCFVNLGIVKHLFITVATPTAVSLENSDKLKISFSMRLRKLASHVT